MRRVDGVDVRDGRFCILDRLFRGFVAEVVGIEVVVHADAADEGSLALFEADVREQVRRGDVFSGVVRGGRGAVGEGSRDAGGVDSTGFGEGREG